MSGSALFCLGVVAKTFSYKNVADLKAENLIYYQN